MPGQRRAGANGALNSFKAQGKLAAALAATRAAIRRLTAAQHRLQARIARDDKRAWVVKRRERTRHLIELGGLVVKAGLVELTDDDRAAMFGLMVEGAATLRSERGDDALALWRRRGKRSFALAAGNEPQP